MTLTWVIFGIIFLFGFVVFRGAPYVPSQNKLINQAFTDLYKLSAKDMLVDIGSGDGRVLRQASNFGAMAVGYELNPILVIISKLLSFNDKKVSVRLVDFWLTGLPIDTTVVYVFSVNRDSEKVYKWIQNESNIKNKTMHLISFGFKIGNVEPVKTLGAYYLYRFNPLQSVKAQV